MRLLQEKAHCLEVPDVVIGAVGTKIYTQLSGSWMPDQDWENQLDEDWDAKIARASAASALEVVGSDNMHFRCVLT